jgi:phytoene synthase
MQKPDSSQFKADLDLEVIRTSPILDIAARFWDDDRYNAFKICYRSMRSVDDLVDDRKADAQILTPAERHQLNATVKHWIEEISGATQGDPSQKLLSDTMSRFQIPIWPWQKLAKSMIYDLSHDGFSTFQTFLRYSEGAAISPGSIFMHLCGVTKDGTRFRAPQFNVRGTARPLALFCYLVHIIRDFQKDQNDNLNYFAENLIAENGLTIGLLREIAAGGTIPPGFRTLMKQYYTYTEYYRRKARRALDNVGCFMEPRYRLSLEIIYNLYLHIFERVDVLEGSFTADEIRPSPEETQARIQRTISTFESN